MADRVCKWHKCGKTFSTSHPRQEFCCDRHRAERAKWLRVRGATLVDLLLNGDMKALIARRRELETEIEKDTPK